MPWFKITSKSYLETRLKMKNLFNNFYLVNSFTVAENDDHDKLAKDRNVDTSIDLPIGSVITIRKLGKSFFLLDKNETEYFLVFSNPNSMFAFTDTEKKEKDIFIGFTGVKVNKKKLNSKLGFDKKTGVIVPDKDMILSNILVTFVDKVPEYTLIPLPGFMVESFGDTVLKFLESCIVGFKPNIDDGDLVFDIGKIKHDSLNVNYVKVYNGPKSLFNRNYKNVSFAWCLQNFVPVYVKHDFFSKQLLKVDL